MQRQVERNVRQPGPIMTDMLPAGDAGKAFKQMVPLGRLGSADEIAGVAAFLAGPDSTYITGTTINVDGGILI